MAEYNAKNYAKQGGDEWHVGGKLVIDEGGAVEGLPAAAIPAATTAAKGGVKMAALVAEAAGAAPTAAEFKALLDALKAAGIMSAT